ncbi:MAG: EF-hand domain-containing protein [Chthoniobacteraceae bacterium]
MDQLNSTDHKSKMKTLITAIAAFAFAGSLALAADEKPNAETPKRDPAKAFAKLDTNSDGKLSMDEFKESPMAKKNPDRAEASFKRRDKNSDGSLSAEEFATRAGGKKKDS